jgi:hypothetical protein
MTPVQGRRVGSGRLTPYLLSGAGVGFVQVDDQFPPIGSTHLQTTDLSPVGAIGGGMVYRIRAISTGSWSPPAGG